MALVVVFNQTLLSTLQSITESNQCSHVDVHVGNTTWREEKRHNAVEINGKNMRIILYTKSNIGNPIVILLRHHYDSEVVN